jgi:hypothetical protein
LLSALLYGASVHSVDFSFKPNADYCTGHLVTISPHFCFSHTILRVTFQARDFLSFRLNLKNLFSMSVVTSSQNIQPWSTVSFIKFKAFYPLCSNNNIKYFHVLGVIRVMHWILDLLTQPGTADNYCAIVNFRTLQIIIAHAKLFPAFCALTKRYLTTASNSGDSSDSRA